MSRFNQRIQTPTVTNRAGGPSYHLDEMTHLASLLLTSFLQDRYYRGPNQEEQAKDLIQRLCATNKGQLFVAKAAIFARDIGMRSIAQIAACELPRASSHIHPRSRLFNMKDFYDSFVVRMDDITECLAYMNNNNQKIPASMKRGFGRAISRADDYQLLKYKQTGKKVSLRDAIRICHPKPSEHRDRPIIRDILNDAAVAANTWESRLSSGESHEDVWRDLIENRKIGHFALLRNLRNIEQKAPDQIRAAAELLVDRDRVMKSRVFPFRYVRAMESVESPRLQSAIDKAASYACELVPKLDQTAVVVDVSASMSGQPFDVAATLAAITAKSSFSDVYLFSTNAIKCTYNGADPLFRIKHSFTNTRVWGGGTRFSAIFEALDKPYKNLIIFTDMQGWMDGEMVEAYLREYKRRFEADPTIVQFDVTGYGTVMFNPNNPKHATISGYSEKMLDCIDFIESGGQSMLEKINSVEIKPVETKRASEDSSR